MATVLPALSINHKIGVVIIDPGVGRKEIFHRPVSANGDQGCYFHGGIYILFLDSKGLLIYIIIHAIEMLPAHQEGEFFVKVHQGAGDPKPVSLGDDEIIDVGVFISKVLG
jgi:hypothetical protein